MTLEQADVLIWWFVFFVGLWFGDATWRVLVLSSRSRADQI